MALGITQPFRVFDLLFNFVVLLLPLLVVVCISSSEATGASILEKANDLPKHRHHHGGRRRQIWAWAGGKSVRIPGQVAQLSNETWNKGLIDGIQLFCGVSFYEEPSSASGVDGDGGIYFNETQWNESGDPIMKVVKDNNLKIKIQLVIQGTLPVIPLKRNITRYAYGARRVYRYIEQKYDVQLDGFSLDDETYCAPTSNSSSFVEWTEQQSRFAMSLRIFIHNDIHLTSAVQALFGIQPIGQDKDACSKIPSAYPIDRTVTSLLQNSQSTVALQKWLVMDTYYFTTARFLSALDWYSTYTSPTQLGIGIMNRDDLSEDELVSRFHSLHFHHPNIDWINVFMLPIDDKFLEYLKRWKTYCLGCGQQSILGCFDMSINCADYSNGEDVNMVDGTDEYFISNT